MGGGGGYGAALKEAADGMRVFIGRTVGLQEGEEASLLALSPQAQQQLMKDLCPRHASLT